MVTDTPPDIGAIAHIGEVIMADMQDLSLVMAVFTEADFMEEFTSRNEPFRSLYTDQSQGNTVTYF